MTSKHSSPESPKPRRITRASLQKISARSFSLAEEHQSSKSTNALVNKTSKVKKNVKFLDSSIEETTKNCSMISDEGIDLSFSPHLKIPSAITRPQHKLKQVISLMSSLFSIITYSHPLNFSALELVVLGQEEESVLEPEPAPRLLHGHSGGILALLQPGRSNVGLFKVFKTEI